MRDAIIATGNHGFDVAYHVERCTKCGRVFTSRKARREHAFEKHSY